MNDVIKIIEKYEIIATVLLFIMGLAFALLSIKFGIIPLLFSAYCFGGVLGILGFARALKREFIFRELEKLEKEND